MQNRLSVILPCYNQDEMTLVHAREVMNVSRIPDEIIVINDGGDPGLLDKLKTLEFKCKFIYARINTDIPWNYNGACNLGAFLSTGDLLAFEDNDNIPSENFYEVALGYLEKNPEVKRVTSKVRHIISREDMLTKPKSEWQFIDSIGANQGTAIIYRDTYALVKGQDEMFCGEYGWMYYEWRRKLLNRAKIKFGSIGMYYYTQQGQSELSRSMSRRNQSLLKKNSREGLLQSPIGILNFTYTYEVLFSHNGSLRSEG